MSCWWKGAIAPPPQWTDAEYWLLNNKRSWLQFLLAEKRRGVERFMIGIEQIREITYEQ
jgi:hypothetical protein